LGCGQCGQTTGGTFPAGVPLSGSGPRLSSVVALGPGASRVSKRRAASCWGAVLGVPLARGEIGRVEQTVAPAVAAPVQEARVDVPSQAAHVEETPWGEQLRRGYLWVAVTQWVRVVVMRAARGAKVLRELVGEA
jgi:hypothetical protein